MVEEVTSQESPSWVSRPKPWSKSWFSDTKSQHGLDLKSHYLEEPSRQDSFWETRDCMCLRLRNQAMSIGRICITQISNFTSRSSWVSVSLYSFCSSAVASSSTWPTNKMSSAALQAPQLPVAPPRLRPPTTPPPIQPVPDSSPPTSVHQNTWLITPQLQAVMQMPQLQVMPIPPLQAVMPIPPPTQVTQAAAAALVPAPVAPLPRSFWHIR